MGNRCWGQGGVKEPQKEEGACPDLRGRSLWQRAGERRVHPIEASGWDSLGKQAHPQTPHTANFLGLLFFAKLPSASLGEQAGSQKEMLDQLWVQQNHLDVLSSIPLSLASRVVLPLRCFRARLGNKQWMSPILIPFCREAEEFIHLLVYSFDNGY